MSQHIRLLPACFSIVAALTLSACDNSSRMSSSTPGQLPEPKLENVVVVSNEITTNLEGPIPPQCYTKTEGQHNPCYTCHQVYDRTENAYRQNLLDDGGLQGDYMFSDVGETNHWKNLFVDRTQWIDSVSDATIDAYISQDNYSQLTERLAQTGWQGFTPDLDNFADSAAAFDEQGFAKDGSYWIAFNYKPFPGTFWPTNGSTDDVIIRLPKEFRERQGNVDRNMYFLNLSLLEMSIKDLPEISIPKTNETALDVDLNGDGQLSENVSTMIKRSYYLGDASEIAVIEQQYPLGTEFMHSVRYVGSNIQGDIFIPKRMKELRYMKKIRTMSKQEFRNRYARERKEKFLGEIPNYVNLGDRGIDNGMGWLVQGFIEDQEGALRPQSYEENLFCMGCHAAIGTTVDQTFAFGRKVTGESGWGYINLKGMPDAKNLNEEGGEILNYLKRNGGGNEFRENDEMLARWYNEDHTVNEEAVKQADVYELLKPSRERALKLNKAYTHIVRHQSFIYGRDATWTPALNVYTDIDQSIAPLGQKFRFYGWDIRLDWSH
ncbi:hypothetical protein IB286_04015 [Spongiibacter sp. KMU-158]|uniref:Lipoprotein n=1 Tax=Spongiibacter pelagi TaxID=2760804 RepID=A0A927BYY9_9GAMM|nr:hypothetical protein [Spongiibacter pelagi]MBD2858163.1 hypothetical protein [Spongiibacter pelagi]